MRKPFQNLAGTGRELLAGRCGTAACTKDQLLQLFGKPLYEGSHDDKVKYCWRFATPRGVAEIRDYWWNDFGEFSIVCNNRKAGMWLAGFLRARGIPASTRFYNLAAVKAFTRS